MPSTVVILSLISLVLLTERSFVNSVKNGGRRVAEFSKEDAGGSYLYVGQRRVRHDAAYFLIHAEYLFVFLFLRYLQVRQ